MGLEFPKTNESKNTEQNKKCCEGVAIIKQYCETSRMDNSKKAIALEFIQKALFDHVCRECFSGLNAKEAEYAGREAQQQ